MTDGKKDSVVIGLHQNVSAFFDKFFARYSSEMRCGLGCSRCCVANLSVFPVEAQVIEDWYFALEPETRQELRNLWTSDVKVSVRNSPSTCTFLVENACTIYEVRPAVCRTQGLPLKVASDDGLVDTDEEKFELSLCELNFPDENKIPNPTEWLDLERLNTLLVIAQKHTGTSVISDGIKAIIEPETGRVGLANLQRLLLQSLA